MARIYQTDLPRHTLEEALQIPEALWNQYAGDPTPPHDVATAIGRSPTSSVWRTLSGAAAGYGLTDGGYNADTIGLTELGESIVAPTESGEAKRALQEAALKPTVLRKFFEKYDRKNLPRDDIMENVLQKQMDVPAGKLKDAVHNIRETGRFVGFLRETPGDRLFVALDRGHEVDREEAGASASEEETSAPAASPEPSGEVAGTSTDDGTEVASEKKRTRPIFIAHGKNKDPVERLKKFLRQFGVPHRVVTDESHRGRPISTQVKEAMSDCGSAIIIFTRDEKFLDGDGNEVWRPSENTVHELGAALFAFDNKVVIFKEKGIELPANYRDIGHIEFEADNFKATESDLLKELVDLKLLQVTPTLSELE